MPEKTEEFEVAWKTATRGVEEAPVRPRRVRRLARRRRLLAIAGVAVAAGGITVGIGATLLAGKSAVDSSFEPPFFSGASSEISFGDAEVVRGHTLLRSYFESAGERPPVGLSARELAAEGLVFRGRLELLGHEGKRLTPVWSLRRLRPAASVPVAVHPSESPIRPVSQHEKRAVSVWLARPRRSGRYVVTFRLENPAGRTLAEARSRPFRILGRGFFAAYRTPQYSARLPASWRFERDFEPVAGRFVTEKRGPGGLSVIVDTTPRASGDPGESARRLHRDHVGIPGYRVLKLQRAMLGPTEVYEWSFELDGRRKTDVFFFRGGDGYAVLADGPPGRFSLVRSVAREVARSVRPVR